MFAMVRGNSKKQSDKDYLHIVPLLDKVCKESNKRKAPYIGLKCL
jgi:hypothetical protein